MTPAEQMLTAAIGHEPRRIAVFRALYLGDLLLAVPAFRALRAGFPQAEITLIGLPGARPFVERFRHYLDRFVEFPGYPGITEVAVSHQRTHAFLSEQRAYGFDLVVQMHGSGVTSNPFTLDLHGLATAGYVEPGQPNGLTYSARYPNDQSEILRNLGLARLLECHAGDTGLEFPVSAEDRAEAASLLTRLGHTRGPLIGIHPGAKFPSRRWIPERFAALADTLMDHYGGRVVITGGPDEIVIAAAVAGAMRHEALILAGETSLGGLAAVIEACQLFISNDTGPGHIATALDTPSIAIFGPADIHRWAPLSQERHRVVRNPVPCSPCGFEDCPIDHRCLRGVTVEDVLREAEELLMRTVVPCAV
jgi:ADP-heptose:LPS heptosyltransferase